MLLHFFPTSKRHFHIIVFGRGSFHSDFISSSGQDIVQTTQSHINPSQFSHRTVKKQVAFHSPLKIRFHPLGGAIFVCQCGTASHASQTQMTRSDTLLSTGLLNFLLQHIQYSIVMSRYIQRFLPDDSSHIHVDATL